MDIYYFSGTGNTLHVAKELQKRMPEANLISIVGLLNENVIEVKGETVGFIFPIYLTSVPAPVRKFLRKLNLKGYL
jgi:flavodoxin